MSKARSPDQDHRPTVERDGESLVVRVPMRISRRCGRKEIVVPKGYEASPSREPAARDPIVTVRARAYRWQELIERGRYPSVTALAEALDLDRSYVARILRLASLAPDVVEAIVGERGSSGLWLETLTKQLPFLWEDQGGWLALRRDSIPKT